MKWRGWGDEADGSGRGREPEPFCTGKTLFFKSVASSVCFRQQLRMKLGYCCPQRHLQSLPYPQIWRKS